jgi:cytoskeletal protein RodZ
MKEISELLKSERLRQGRTLEDVSEQAHVSINMLQLLEEAQYERIGTPLLIRSFIKAYCSALGVDPVPLLEQHEREILTYDRQGDGIKQYGVWTKAFRRKGRKGRVFFLLLILIVVAALYGGGAWFSRSKARLASAPGVTRGIYTQNELPADLREGAAATRADESKDATATPADQATKSPEGVTENKIDAPVVVGKAPDSDPAKSDAEGANPAEVLAEDKPKIASRETSKHRLEVEAAQETWIQIKIDGKKVQNATLRSGEKREWEAENNMQIVVGKGASVALKWDGQAVATKAKPGRILRIKLPLSEPAKKPATP